MKIIDNKQGKTLSNEIKNRIEPDAVVSLSKGFFTVYALYSLREKLSNIKELNILILSNPITQLPEGLSITTESSIWGTDNEKELKRQLLLRQVAEECSKIVNHVGYVKILRALQ